jgi:hypothetical protein
MSVQEAGLLAVKIISQCPNSAIVFEVFMLGLLNYFFCPPCLGLLKK